MQRGPCRLNSHKHPRRRSPRADVHLDEPECFAHPAQRAPWPVSIPRPRGLDFSETCPHASIMTTPPDLTRSKTMWLQALTAFGAGSTVTILSDVIYPTHIGDTPLESCAAPSGSNMCAQGSVVVEPPLAPLVPSASVTAPQLVGVCDDLELTLSGRCELRVHWCEYLENCTIRIKIGPINN